MSSWHSAFGTHNCLRSSEIICKTTTESNNGEPVHEVPVEKESPEDTGDDLVVPDSEENTSEQSRSDIDTGETLASVHESGEQKRPIDEVPDAEVVDIEEQNGNEENGQVMCDQDQDEQVENEETPAIEDDEPELMMEESKVEPAWLNVDINEEVVIILKMKIRKFYFNLIFFSFRNFI